MTAAAGRAGRFQGRDKGGCKLDGFYTTEIKDERREINKVNVAMRRVSGGGEEMLINESDKKSVESTASHVTHLAADLSPRRS